MSHSRLYFTNATGNLPTPVSGTWTTTAQMTRFLMKPYKDGVTPVQAQTINIGASAGNSALDRMFITPGLNGAQTISGRVSGQLMVRELNTNDDVNRILITARVVHNNGVTIRGVLLPWANYGPTAEFLNNAVRNKSIISGAATVNVSPVAAQDGDRIVLEIGYQVSAGGTSPQAAAAWGGGAFSSPDLPQDETTTTAAAGWFDFGSVDLNFRQTQFIETSDEET
jgi:hypothetical protein